MILRITHERLVLLVILVLVVLACVMCYKGNSKNKRENFINHRVVGSSFAQYYHPNPNPNPHQGSCSNLTAPNPQSCTPENNCFPGSYLRSQVYQNMCEPTDTPHLLRNKVQTRDNCLRSLGNPLNTQNLECKINVHDQRKCSWQKK